MENKPTISWLCVSAEEAKVEKAKLKTSGFKVKLARNAKFKIIVIGKKGQNDLFEQVEKALGEKV